MWIWKPKETVVLPEIPEEVLIEILIRLSVKSLMRLKCVSKLWLSRITSKYFTNVFLKSSSSRQRIFIITSSSDASVSFFNQDLTMPRIEGKFVNAVRGLACFATDTRLQICNVYTRQVVELPQVSCSNACSTLGYNSVHDEYKVLSVSWQYCEETRVRKVKCQVLVLAPGASWRKIQCHIPHMPIRLIRSNKQCISIDGVLYYEASIVGTRLGIMSFDMSSENFSFVKFTLLSTTANLMNYKGKIAFLEYDRVLRDGTIHIWVVEDFDKSVINKMTFVLPISQMGLVRGVRMGGTRHSGEVWLRKSFPIGNQLTEFFIYDLERKEITQRIQKRSLCDDRVGSSNKTNYWLVTTFWDDTENIMHLEI